MLSTNKIIILNDYVTELEGGHTNTIIKLKDDKVVRLSDRGKDELEYEWELHNYLKQNLIHTPRPFLIENEKVALYFYKNKILTGIKLEYINGNCIDINNVYDLVRIGSLLGRLHCIPVPHFSRQGKSINLVNLQKLKIPISFLEVLEFNPFEIIREIFSISDQLHTVLCHGDLYWSNAVKKDDDNSIYMIDLESMGLNYSLLDLGKCIYGFITPNKILPNIYLTQCIIEGYTKYFKLNNASLKVLPHVVALCGYQVGLWRFNYYKNNPTGRLSKNSWVDSIKTANNWFNMNI